MKKIVIFNPNVGSALEQSGNIITSWINEIDGIEIYTISEQTSAYEYVKKLNNIRPDIIVINDYYRNIAQASSLYRHFNANVRIIYLEYVWQRTTGVPEDDYPIYTKLLYFTDEIFYLNYAPARLRYTNNYYMPTDPNKFKITKSWTDREKKFAYIGTITDIKLSPSFIKAIVNTDITIDCYGNIHKNCSQEYVDLLSSCKSIILKGYIPFENIQDTMNEYKYFVLPHDGSEPFNWSLLQCIFCGMIPFVVNDRTRTNVDTRWIDWASGLNIEFNNVDNLIHFMKNITDIDEKYFAELSEKISQSAMEKFDYYKFKNDFIQILTSYV